MSCNSQSFAITNDCSKTIYIEEKGVATAWIHWSPPWGRGNTTK